MAGYVWSRIFTGSLFPKGEPLISKLSSFSQYILFPSAMFASLIYCPENDPNKKKTPKLT